ncbi:uncharacterized protein CMU_003020 [Cryptosporidium muris RN66]|uniref:Uncharacterized protein n=1 Tax=Cryptosporidium muris (strain RN66) TaxID=441375 RepID=B6AJT1_CRYMR|nr:uncharacterized protein CMU_003020 [Cryptosporidium muris RN66]EEA08472.1 hypothetical protein CMU_003020 [Cryptosporidium muris RN66]|eukprot:XP_002142821.1 hypothetical protein [Cryptosporidium muris RN66]
MESCRLFDNIYNILKINKKVVFCWNIFNCVDYYSEINKYDIYDFESTIPPEGNIKYTKHIIARLPLLEENIEFGKENIYKPQVIDENSNLNFKQDLKLLDYNIYNRYRSPETDISSTRSIDFVEDLIGNWILDNELSEDLGPLLTFLGVGIMKRKIANNGNFILKVVRKHETILEIILQPFLGPSQVMTWNLTGEEYYEKNSEVGFWKNKIKIVKFKHQRTNGIEVYALQAIRTNEKINSSLIETRWCQPHPLYKKIKYIRYQ